jgi:acyl dehydratase
MDRPPVTGTTLPLVKKTITQQDIDRYAKVSGDFNPIHVDPEYARRTPLGGTVAHGMLLLAYVSQVMTKAFGKAWLENGKIHARFKAPAHPGDQLTISGAVTKVDTDHGTTLVCCDIFCRNQNGEELISAATEVKIKQ